VVAVVRSSLLHGLDPKRTLSSISRDRGGFNQRLAKKFAGIRTAADRANGLADHAGDAAERGQDLAHSSLAMSVEKAASTPAFLQATRKHSPRALVRRQPRRR
jgi:hypothetical protein